MSWSTILSIVTCISFYQLALIAFFNPTKFNNAANKWFALCFFAVGCMVLNWVIYQQSADAAYTRLIAFNELSRFIIAPALYLAAVQFTSPYKSLKRKDYLHFIPFALFFVYMAPFVITNGNWTISLNFPLVLKQWLPVIVGLSIKVQLFIYLLLSIYQLRKHQRNVLLINANVDGVNLKWLQYLIFSIAGMLLIWYAGMIFSSYWMAVSQPVIYLAGALLTGYFLLAQKEIYPFDKLELAEIDRVINPESSAIPAQRFKEEILEEHKEKLIRLMQTKCLYMDNELSLPDLADAMNMSTHDLSHVLNKGLNMSFYQFINSYRVEEAKRLMLSKDNKHLNMLGIAYGAGFNSKTTFNTFFKKQTGLSPSQFIEQAKAVQPTELSLQKMN
ncbi:helix-turn-helix domain-containing protein [Mucilaginibacter sp. X4EP1]|uniref:helix-turn-helix domain-containing protein n=1 Tax=Mucilaginibacter sp. X4EP1 TaxID=2723092 RepID=UPI00216741EE|nr:helix-turn-helix domain-containing protein [Mucilaginibacter sp. X4EP1]MCS3812482.1 AraC-like DNA-binding protein [Mucilaginibacter sp. X4EP1]